MAGFVLPAEGQSPAAAALRGRRRRVGRPRRRPPIDTATRAVDRRRAAPTASCASPARPTEQLSVTRYFAARGYDIVGVGLDREIAVDPVAERYPDTRFSLVDSRDLPSTVAPPPRADAARGLGAPARE